MQHPNFRHVARHIVLVSLLTGLLWLVWASDSALADERWAEEEAGFVAQVNAERSAAGLPPLSANAALRTVARDWSAVLARDGRLHHNPDLAAQAPGDWQAVGENVGMSTHPGLSSSEQVDRLHAAFMASAAHRANALGDWNQIAVGVVVAPPDTMWVTINFLRAPLAPAPAQDPAPAPAQAAPPPAAPAHVAEALAVSREVFTEPGSARHVVLARAEAFADALGGAALAGADGPILFTPGPTTDRPDRPLPAEVRAEIDRVLAADGTVYLLGGRAAISAAVEDELATAGLRVARLSGSTRTDTAVRIAEEVQQLRGDRQAVLLASAEHWPDAVTGGAWAAHAGVPVLLTGRDGLPDSVRAFLARVNPTQVWLVGGPAAVSDETAAAAGATRISGRDRTATAVAVAEQLWGREQASAGDGLVLIPGYRDDGWAFALSYAPLSASRAHPQLLVGEAPSPALVRYLLLAGYDRIGPTPLRFASTVPATATDAVRALVNQ